jgi:VWFA-related protein
MLLCLQILVCAHAAPAQENYPKASLGPVQPQAEPTVPSGTNRRVMIDVTVTDSKGMPVPGLAQQDFTLLDNKKPMPIASFEAFGNAQTPARPDTVILVVDAVNLEFRYVSYARQELDHYFRENEGHLAAPLSVFVTSDTGVSGLGEPTTNGIALADALGRYQGGLRMVGRSAGAYGADERFQMSIQMFMSILQYAAGRPGRKLIIWIGPGWPMLSGPRFNGPSQKSQRQLFEAIVRISTAMRQHQITLDSISAGFPDALTFLYQSYLKGVKSPDGADTPYLGEKVIADQSGGIVIPPSFNLPVDIGKCIDDASVFYRLSFDAGPADKPDQYHSLEVKAGKRDLKAMTNTGYYDQP